MKYQFSCHSCLSDYKTIEAGSIEEAKIVARKQGWRNDGDYWHCPICSSCVERKHLWTEEDYNIFKYLTNYEKKTRDHVLYADFSRWCLGQGEKPPSHEEFNDSLKEQGFLCYYLDGVLYWLDVKLPGN